MAQLPKGETAPQDGLLPEQAKHDADSRTFHAYVHVPFCRVRCGYCDFNTYTAQEIGSSSQSSFARDLSSEISFSKSVLINSEVPLRPISTVFFGGGTPTLLPAEDLVSMLDSLRDTLASYRMPR
jgi:coproporphyrinogen III oxidase-like Fe-S oxidoreductase